MLNPMPNRECITKRRRSFNWIARFVRRTFLAASVLVCSLIAFAWAFSYFRHPSLALGAFPGGEVHHHFIIAHGCLNLAYAPASNLSVQPLNYSFPHIWLGDSRWAILPATHDPSWSRLRCIGL